MEATIYDMNWSSIKDAEGEEIRTLSLYRIAVTRRYTRYLHI